VKATPPCSRAKNHFVKLLDFQGIGRRGGGAAMFGAVDRTPFDAARGSLRPTAPALRDNVASGASGASKRAIERLNRARNTHSHEGRGPSPPIPRRSTSAREETSAREVTQERSRATDSGDTATLYRHRSPSDPYLAVTGASSPLPLGVSPTNHPFDASHILARAPASCL